jgi:ribonuclease VapC
MFIETSAIVAIILNEPEAIKISKALENAANCFTSPHVRLEACMVLSSRLDEEPTGAEGYFDDLINQTGAKIIDLTDNIAHLAVITFAKYGKGRGHPAQLNLADCLSYACAKAHNAPILFKGRDFSHTDLKIVKY